MRKRVFGYQLSRDSNERKALFRALVSSLIEKGEIETTLVKAKATQKNIEKLITRAKGKTLADRRITLRFLTKTDLVSKLFDVIAPVFKERNGGYTRIVRTEIRQGDAAQMARISFVEELPIEIKKGSENTQSEKEEKIVKKLVKKTKKVTK